MSPMNPRKLVPTQEPGILDFAPGAAAAYSLRNLSLSYSGPVVTVRRSTDDAEADFTAAEVSDGTLAAFCGAGDGFVKQWWDQSGNANHAVAAADANEPKIVDSGVVVTEEGKPAIQFDGSDDYFNSLGLLAFSDEQNKAVFFVGTAGNNSNLVRALFIGVASSTRVSLMKENQTSYAWSGNTFGNRVFADATVDSQNLIYASDFVGEQAVSVNAGIASTNSLGGTNAGTDTAQIGAVVGTQTWDGTMQEMIIYAENVSTVSDRIIGNIAWSYSL